MKAPIHHVAVAALLMVSGMLNAMAGNASHPEPIGTRIENADEQTSRPLQMSLRQVHDLGDSWRWNMHSWDNEKILSYGGYQYVGCWNGDGMLSVARRDLKTDALQVVTLDWKLSQDNPHRSVAIGISPGDGRLHIAFDNAFQRTTPELRYRRSREGWITDPPETIRASDFLPMEGMTSKENLEYFVVYPRFIHLNDGTLLFSWHTRGPQGRRFSDHKMLNRYDARQGRWEHLGEWFAGHTGIYTRPGDPNSGSPGRQQYLNQVVVDENDWIHVSWTYKETTGIEGNQGLYYAYSKDRGVTWHNTDGAQVADLGRGLPITIDSPGVEVVGLPTYSWIVNNGAMALDGRGNPHVIYQMSATVTQDVIERNHHHSHLYRDDQGQWHQNWITPPDEHFPGLRNRGTLLADSNDDLHFYVRRGSRLEYYRARAAEEWKDWTRLELAGLDPIGGGSGFRYDPFRWRRDGILDIPMVGGENRLWVAEFLLRESPGKPKP